MSLGQRAGINKGSWGVASWWARKPCGDSEQSLLDRSQWSVSSVRCWWQFKTCTLNTNKTAKSVWNSNYTNLLKDWILSAKPWNNMGCAVDCCHALLFQLNILELPCMVWSPPVLLFLTSVYVLRWEPWCHLGFSLHQCVICISGGLLLLSLVLRN